LIGVTGNAKHPMTRGGLCVKLKVYEKHHYHPDRLLYLLKRTGAFLKRHLKKRGKRSGLTLSIMVSLQSG